MNYFPENEIAKTHSSVNEFFSAPSFGLTIWFLGRKNRERVPKLVARIDLHLS
jgi:hypothetical protein